MGYAVELYLDEASTEKLFRLAGEIDDFLIENQFRPHVSLAVFESVDGDALCAVVKAFADSIERFELQLTYPATFTGEGVVFIAPVVTSDLLALHRRFHKGLQAHKLTSQGYYIPGNWVPHVTVGYGLARTAVPSAIAQCMDSDVYGPVEVQAIGVTEHLPVRKLCLVGI